MSMVLDVLILLIALLCAYFGWRGGFMKAVISFFGFIIALVGGYMLSPHLGNLLLPSIQKFFENESEDSFLGIIGGFDITSRIVSNVMAFGILFILLNILIFIVKIIVKNIFSLPVLRQADKLLGCLLGVILGYLFVSVASILLFTFSEVLIRAFDFMNAEMFEGSVIARWFYEHNIFEFIMKIGA